MEMAKSVAKESEMVRKGFGEDGLGRVSRYSRQLKMACISAVNDEAELRWRYAKVVMPTENTKLTLLLHFEPSVQQRVGLGKELIFSLK